VTTRVAAIDCGTNSLRLLIADVDPQAGRLVDVQRRMEIVRLGQGVDATGVIAPEAMARALAVTTEYARSCTETGVSRIRFVATSASRDARNAAEFVAGVRAVLGVEPEVISGREEAELSFVGATRGLAGARPPFLVVDIGGGSTEFVLGRPGVRPGDPPEVDAAISVDVGCVRITERHLAGDPPTSAQVEAARRDILAAVDAAAATVPIERAGALVGLAGSVTTVTAHALRLDRYDSTRIHGCVLPVDRVRAACTELLGMTRRERAALRYLHPGRVDVIGAGALVWQLVVTRVAEASGLRDVVASEHDILDGIAWALAGA
jgi:exopolyphosphatase/guanosine-5'-triphosphate,3'-diphosphate pyrophosphatase